MGISDRKINVTTNSNEQLTVCIEGRQEQPSYQDSPMNSMDGGTVRAHRKHLTEKRTSMWKLIICERNSGKGSSQMATSLRDIRLEDCVLVVKGEEAVVQRLQNKITVMDRVGVEYKKL